MVVGERDDIVDELRLLGRRDPAFLTLVERKLQQLLHFGGPCRVFRVNRDDVGGGVMHLNIETNGNCEPAHCSGEETPILSTCRW